LRSDIPSGWEFDACGDCNKGTSASDQIFALFVYSNVLSMTREQERHVRKIALGIRNNQPHVIDEILRNASPVRSAGVLYPPTETMTLVSMGPCIQSHLDRVADKLALSAFYKYFGRSAPPTCLVSQHWITNYSMIDGKLPELPIKLNSPIYIRQGKKTSKGQFVVQGAGEASGNAVFRFIFQNRVALISLICTPEENDLPLIVAEGFRKPMTQTPSPPSPISFAPPFSILLPIHW
jgi:hypothetical protein